MAHIDGELLVYDLATGRPSRRWPGQARAHDLAFRADGAQIAVTCNEQASPAGSSKRSQAGSSGRSRCRSLRTSRLEPRRHHAGDAVR